MARGRSGRIVLEIDPHRKEELYAALEKEGLTLKEWFLGRARDYLRNRNQTDMFAAVAEASEAYGPGKKDAE